MAKISIPSIKKGFSVINGKMYEVKLKSYICDLDDRTNDIFIVENNGVDYDIERSNLYLSVEDAKKNNPISWEGFNFCSIGNAKIDECFVASYWTFKDGKADYYHSKIGTVRVDFGVRNIVSSPDIPDETYSSSEECYMFNDVTVVHDDGTKDVVRGIGSLCMLTDEQRSVVDEIGKLVKKAYDMGVRFTSDWNNSYAFNVNNISDYAICFDERDACFDNTELVDLTDDRFKAGFYIPVSNDDDCLWVSRKKD